MSSRTRGNDSPGAPVEIRAARSSELPVLRDIERAAGAPFRDIGMAAIADDEPLSVAELDRFRREGRAWVAVDHTGFPVAYLIAGVVDGNLHIEQVSVHPDRARRRIGRRLLEHAADRARADGRRALTLTTFVDVPWNAPYYRRCGFRELGPDQITPGLREIRQREAALGLDRWPRVCMRREVVAPVREG